MTGIGDLLREFNLKFRKDFEAFFSGLYEEEKVASILYDLSQFITNGFLNMIIFGYLNEEGHIFPYSKYEISKITNLSTKIKREEAPILNVDKSDKRQRILCIEISERFKNFERENTLGFLKNVLENDWSYLIDLELEGISRTDYFFFKEPLFVKRGIKDGEV